MTRAAVRMGRTGRTRLLRPPGLRILSLALVLSACWQDVEVEPVERGEAGESCEANDHCAAGLACVDLVCREKGRRDGGGADGGDDGGEPPALPTRSGPGESCGRRADCEAGLSCLRNQCRAVDDAPDPLLSGPTRGGRGESCAASNDCEAGLGCILGACRARNLGFESTAKECFRVDCLADADCCEGHQPDDPALCAELESSCESGVQSDCNLFTGLCECNRACDEGVCVSAVACEGDAECGGSGVLLCVDGRCAQCASDGDCAADSHCVGGLCRAQCEYDNDCPLLSRCEQHQCVEVGCESDRECYFVTQNPRSRCNGGECVTPCEDDAECLRPQQGCVEGACDFVGCESDAECRAALDLAGGSASGARATCRMPE